MNINLSDYFPVTPEEVNDFEKLLRENKESPPEDGFDRLWASKDATEKLNSFQTGKMTPPTFGILIETLCNALGKNRFQLAGEFKIDGPSWNKVILTQARPDILAPRLYCIIAKVYGLSIDMVKKSLEGSFQFLKSGISGAGPVYTRSHTKETKTSYVTSAMHELMKKAGRTSSALDQNAINFLKEIV